MYPLGESNLPSEASGRWEDQVEFGPRPTNLGRLHELGHIKLGHTPGKMTTTELINKELDAETYAWDVLGKPHTFWLGAPAFTSLVEEYGYKPSQALALVGIEMQKRGIKLDKRMVHWVTGFK